MSAEHMEIDVPATGVVGTEVSAAGLDQTHTILEAHNSQAIIDSPGVEATNQDETSIETITHNGEINPMIGEENVQKLEPLSNEMDTSVPQDIKIDLRSTSEPFYLRYYSGYKGRFGHEFLEFDIKVLDDGSSAALRYANNSNYRNDDLIRKEVAVGALVVRQLKQMIAESEILREDDSRWPEKNKDGKQELEIRAGKYHISFETSKLGSLNDVQNSNDPEGLRVFYYLIQDLKALVFSLISLHFKIKPI
ncbi:hypothetical protein NADFUDRAFT_50642 [Nadsonia fulvescens var. elongata DSM 6958]|uniref:Mago nashi protein n=1 Tax=Nadsonia fulvescens var. elongata DSM 6958 TaxID=857566 RepID=A0A1E3PNC7_9ASCO|nr:hypothetical protein NADFUDRAFT_50642 [Nadsonia fulvescens var. elongata DSM 6958]